MHSPADSKPWVDEASGSASCRTQRYPPKRASTCLRDRPRVEGRRPSARMHMAANACRRGKLIPRSHIVRSCDVTLTPAISTISRSRSVTLAAPHDAAPNRPPGSRKQVHRGHLRDGHSARAPSAPRGASRGPVGDDGVLGHDQAETSRRSSSAVGQLGCVKDAVHRGRPGPRRDPAHADGAGRLPGRVAQLAVKGRSIGTGADDVEEAVAGCAHAHSGFPRPTAPQPAPRPGLWTTARSPSRHMTTRRPVATSLCRLSASRLPLSRRARRERRRSVEGGALGVRRRRTRSSRRSRWSRVICRSVPVYSTTSPRLRHVVEPAGVRGAHAGAAVARRWRGPGEPTDHGAACRNSPE